MERMDFARAVKYQTRVSETYYLNDSGSFLCIKLELIDPERINFQAGQYVSVKLNKEGERRSYSIVSTPDVTHGVTLVAEILPEGKGSGFLKKLKPGDEVEIMAPLGRFVADQEAKKLLFVATGSGIAPIYSMINDQLINKRDRRPMRLHWGMREESQIFWLDNLQRLAEAHPQFVFDVVLSRPSDRWDLCTGHVQDCLGRDLAGQKLRDWAAHICGNPQMVIEVSTLMKQMGMPEANVHHEKFV